MKLKITYIILIGIILCLFISNVRLWYLYKQHTLQTEALLKTIEHLTEVEFMHTVSKELTASKIMYEQHDVSNTSIYMGSDKKTRFPISDIIDCPKLILGLNETMCAPCILSVVETIKEAFPDFENNPDIILIADLEQRFKDNYYNKKVLSFSNKADFPLYSLKAPYFFILDKDLVVKMLFITDKTSPDLTKEYLKIIKHRFFDE